MNWAGSWSAVRRVLGPVDADLIEPVITVAADDELAVGSGRTSEDAPGVARAALITGGAANTYAAQLGLSASQQALALGYLGHRLIVLDGASTGNLACCSSAALQTVDGRTLGTGQPLAAGLEGASYGALVPVRGGLLALVDNQAGITAARSDAAGRFGASRQLVPSDPTPPVMAAGPLTDGGALVAWTAPVTAAQTVTGTTTTPGASGTAHGYDQPQNQLIQFATAGRSGGVGATRTAVTVAKGREIDALAVTPHGRGATLAWTESWFAGRDTYRSAVFWTDVGAGGSGGRVHRLSGTASAAVGLSLGGSARGGEVLTWQACATAAGTCATVAALRPRGHGWGAALTLGAVDPTDFPVAGQSRLGQSLVGWISGGVVHAAAARPGASTFFAPQRVSRAAGASNLALSFGAGAEAAAVWVQGTYRQRLVGARFTR